MVVLNKNGLIIMWVSLDTSCRLSNTKTSLAVLPAGQTTITCPEADLSLHQTPVPLKVGNARPNVHAEGKFGGLFQNLWLSHTKVFDTHWNCLTPTVPRWTWLNISQGYLNSTDEYALGVEFITPHSKLCRDIVLHVKTPSLLRTLRS